MNLTLSIDENLLKEARKAALEMDTSVNSLIRKYLEGFVEKKKQEKEVFLQEWRKLMEASSIDMKQKAWTRDELHER